MNRHFDSVDASDVQEDEALRQSELVNRMVHRIQENPLAGCNAQQLERSIMSWLLDNNLVITRDLR